jgi:hypothetical protein
VYVDWRFAASIAIAALGACSSQPQVNAIRTGDGFAITRAADTAGSPSLDVHSKSIGPGVKTGAEAGCAAGAAAGQVRGPLSSFVRRCSPVLARSPAPVRER